MSVEQQTHSLVDDFAKASAGLFEITGRYIEHFEQGVYGCAIAKPTKRMRAALAIDREILVVVSTFKDQQQRTIKFLTQEIQKSMGRLEASVAVVIHKDPDGNSKLRNWGRDRGLSILPIVEGESLEGVAALERALCIELYSHDPFDVTGPVSDDANFFGRRDEAIELARKLQKGQIRSCLGIRKVGKTSILNRMLRELQSSHDCTCIMADCSRDDVWGLSAAELLNSISTSAELAVSNKSNYQKLVVSPKETSLSECRSRLEHTIQGVGRPFILVFDEVDYITPGSPTNQEWRTEFNVFWRNLRAVYQEIAREQKAFSVLVAGVSANWFTVESIEGLENAALAFVPEEYLSPLPLGATVAMLRRLGKVAGLSFDESAAELMALSAGNMPYWARKCASYVNRQVPVLERPCDVSRERIQPMVSSFVKEEGAAIAEVALRHLFRVFPVLQQATKLCHEGLGGEVSEREKRILRRYGVIDQSSDRLAGQMMQLAFSAIKDAEVVTPERKSVPVATLELGLNEWAEELAAIGKRRNLLEKRLRDIVLYFLRFELMNSGKSSEIHSRIVSILPEKQRAQFAHLSAEETMAKINWTDLVKLVVREWQLFERLFGDKDQFVRNCDVINDRFDAHAKAADSADFAMYRRCLSQIEDRLAKLQ
jgi:hypothetical protein